MKRIKTLVTVWRPAAGGIPCVHDMPSDAELRASVPAEVELGFLEPNQKLSEHLEGVEVLYGPLPEKDLPKADRLRWVQLNSTGADVMMYEAFLKSGITLTTLGGAITVTVAEHALSLLFALARNLHLQRDLQRDAKWDVLCGVELGKLRLGLLGFGRIGRAIAARAQAFGMEITAVDAAPGEAPEYVEALWGPERLPDLLQQSNAVICSVPKTPETVHMLAAAQLEMMPPGSFLVNVGRGGIIDEKALLSALQSGRLGGAALDVTEVEPLPAESPLWYEPKVLITPHSAGFSRDLREKKIKWFADNLARYIRGETLQGRVDPRRTF
jgi:D-2-hydroxyacid dehydrogenase (NADP+)